MRTTTDQRRTCWTCRLRHKRCDGLLPTCGICATLQIRCHFAQEKPQWMDNGQRQQDMAQQIKIEVKQSGKRRRGIALMQNVAIQLASSPAESRFGPDSSASSHAMFTTSTFFNSSSTLEDTTCDSSRELVTHSNLRADRRGKAGHTHREAPAPGWPASTSAASVVELVTHRRSELDMGFIQGYMDYIFPLFFPHYRPPLLKGGRSWLLVLATSNIGFFNAISSLSSFCFSVIPVRRGTDHDRCSSEVWEGLREQSSTALASVQQDLQDLRSRAVVSSLTDSVHLLANIVQLLKFELELTPSSKWQMHLDAAVRLLERILHHGDGAEPASSMSRVIRQMAGPEASPAPNPISAEQGALRFYSAILIVYDIMASTCLEQTPRLRSMHYEIQHNDRDDDDDDDDAALSLEDITGCQSWVLLMIGDIAALDAWKKAEKRGGDLQRVELIHRADPIERQLQDGLERLNHQIAMPAHERIGAFQNECLLEATLHLSNSSYGLHPSPSDKYIRLTQIWALAARTYLLVVLNGWQPTDPEISSNVTQTLELARQIQSPSWLRSLVWPLCVSGCLATEDQRPAFRSIVVDATGPLRVLGTVREASHIMEDIWVQPVVDPDSRDIAACLKTLGHAALIV